MNLIAFKYHDNCYFHGDIKPENIFFDQDLIEITTDVGSLLYLGEKNDSN